LITIAWLHEWKWLLVNIPLSYGLFIIALYRPGNKPFNALEIIFLSLVCISLPIGCFITFPFLTPRGTYN